MTECTNPATEAKEGLTPNLKLAERNTRPARPRVFISQPMRGKTDEEIRAEREEVTARLEAAGYEVADTYFANEFTAAPVRNAPLYYLASALRILSTCDAAVFLKGWHRARGCQIEHACCHEYGIEILPVTRINVTKE